MKCDFYFQEKPCRYVGYGECACDECTALYLEKVKGGYAFKPNAPRIPYQPPKPPERESFGQVF